MIFFLLFHLLPCYKKLTSFLKGQGVNNIFVDSDGNMDSLIPLLLEGGVNGIKPLENQAGTDIVKLRKDYPGLKMIGGINKMALFKGKNEIDRELEKVPFMLKEGGFIPIIDHSVPPNISWNNFKYYRESLNNLIDRYKII